MKRESDFGEEEDTKTKRRIAMDDNHHNIAQGGETDKGEEGREYEKYQSVVVSSESECAWVRMLESNSAPPSRTVPQKS